VVRQIASGTKMIWDLKDDSGQNMASGVYLAVAGSAKVKIVIVK
jgi:hypothetical protein